MFKQVLLASVAAMGMFAYATQSSQVSATDSPNVVDILPANPTKRALVLEAKEYGVDYTIERLDWMLKIVKYGFWQIRATVVTISMQLAIQ